MSQRSAGTSVTASAPASRLAQNRPGESAPPGNRQLIPIRATGRAAAATALAPAGTGAGTSPIRSLCSLRASASGVGWSKMRVAGSIRPVARDSRLRSSTEVSESNPSSLKGRPRSRPEASVCPRVRAACPATKSVMWRARSATGSPARVRRSCSPASAGRPSAAVWRRTAAGRSPDSSGGSCAARRRSSLTGTVSARLCRSASSHSAVPSAAVRAPTPSRAMRARSACAIVPVIPPSCSHSPQASEMPGSPAARRRATIASTAALAAA